MSPSRAVRAARRAGPSAAPQQPYTTTRPRHTDDEGQISTLVDSLALRATRSEMKGLGAALARAGCC
jgi:hypothetical protein